MPDPSTNKVNADTVLARIIETVSHDAACAADALEATAAELGEAIDALIRQRPDAAEVIARLRDRRAWLIDESASLRDLLRRSDDVVTARMAAGLLAEFNRAEAEIPPAGPPVLRVVQ